MATTIPALVAGYARRAAPDPVTGPVVVRVTQCGRMRMKPTGRWMPFTALEYFAIDRVQFRWEARFPLAPITWLTVTDGFEAGEGALRARLWGHLPIMRAEGADVTRGEAMRYLAELFWVPQALVANPELHWSDETPSSVRVTTAAAGDHYGVTFHFDTDGDIVGVHAEARPRQVGKGSVDTAWYGEIEAYGMFSGMRVPSHARVSWDLPEGRFTYWEGEVTDIAVVPAGAE